MPCDAALASQTLQCPFPGPPLALEAGGARRKTLTLLLILIGKANNALLQSNIPVGALQEEWGFFEQPKRAAVLVEGKD